MGGLSKIFTKTHWLFLIGALALAGLPPFAVFFSKDLILEQEYLSGHEILFYVGFVASILTGIYMMRAYCLTFRGASHLSAEDAKTVHEAPNVMLIPVSLLAVLAVVGGLLGYTFSGAPWLEHFLREVGVTNVEEELHSGFVLTTETWIVLICASLGVAISAWVYTRPFNRIPPPFALLKNQFYYNELCDVVFVRPLKALSRSIVQFLEPTIFDGMVMGSAHAARGVAKALQHVQSGQIRSYLAWMVLGAVLLLVYVASS